MSATDIHKYDVLVYCNLSNKSRVLPVEQDQILCDRKDHLIETPQRRNTEHIRQVSRQLFHKLLKHQVWQRKERSLKRG